MLGFSSEKQAVIFSLYNTEQNGRIETVVFCIFSLQYKLFFLIFVSGREVKGDSLFFRGKSGLWKEHGGHASDKREGDSVENKGVTVKECGLDVAVPVRRNAFISFFWFMM